MSNALPKFAAWRHVEARDGFEIVFIRVEADGFRFEGQTVAVEAGRAWWVEYAIDLSPAWVTRSARVSSHSGPGRREVLLEADGHGGWRVDGLRAAHLDGCLDVDLESSALTNAYPVHRLGLRASEAVEAPAAYVRVPDLRVERLEQTYRRIESPAPGQRFAYRAPAFGFEAELTYDEAGLVSDYPGLAVRPD